jgi:23S rRNA pseudouridine2605 synthase
LSFSSDAVIVEPRQIAPHAGAVRSPTHARKETSLIAEQLQAARAAHWRQQQSPILTLDDAESWLAQHPLCLYLPRQAQLPAPAPSFVEACMGSRQATPGVAAIEQAQQLLTRLIASGTVVPLNLLGTVGEQPDFLAHREALPYVLALRADPDWKHAPQKSSGHKVSPLVLELWKVLDKEGALTAIEAREILGRELTEAAVLRALCELWQTLRISPVLAEKAGQPARWEMLRVQHRAALETGSTTSQVTALSLLVSMYLQSVYAATSEEIEIFLSPVASRSRVREAVRGLSATRQLHALSMDAQTYHFLENGLPEFTPQATPSAAPEAEPSSPASSLQRPRPRKIQATARPDLPASSPAAPSAGSAPIFRRTKSVPASAPRFEKRPEAGPTAKPATRPAASAGWKPPARPGSPERPAWKPAGKPPTGGERWVRKDEGIRGGGKPRSASAARPPASPTRSGARPYARPGAGAPDSRRSARPDARGGTRPNRPGAWSGAEKRDRPAPWALPGRKPSSASRPPRAGGRSAAPFRPQQRRDRPGTGAPSEGTAAFPPRAPRGDRGPGDPSRARSTPGRAPGRPPAYGAKRSPAPYRSNQARSDQPRRSQTRSEQGPSDRTRSGPPPQGGRPSAPRPARFGASPSGAPRPGNPRPDNRRSGNAGRPFPRPSKPGVRPGARPGGPRPPSSEGAGQDTRPKPNPRGPGNERPRSGGYARPAGKPRPSEGEKGRSDRGPRPPFVPGSRPAKSWQRPGGSSAKPGKPSFRGRKPDRKKPGA